MDALTSPTPSKRPTGLRMCSGYTRVSLNPRFHTDPCPNPAEGYAFGLNLCSDCVADLLARFERHGVTLQRIIDTGYA